MHTVKLSLQSKLLCAFLITALFAIFIIGWQSYRSAYTHLMALTFEHLKTIRESKKFEIEEYFKNIQNLCVSMAENHMTIQAMRELNEAFHTIEFDDAQLETYKKDLRTFYEKEFLPKFNETANISKTLDDFFPHDPLTIIFQTLYLAYNPNPIAKKSEYLKALDGSAYSELHAKYHDVFSHLIKRFGFLDFYLIDVDTGHVIFNISKEIDFATNLETGPLRSTSLAKLFDIIQKTTDQTSVQITDFDFYAAEYGVPTAFIGSPIYQDNVKIGCLIFELPINKINDIMTYEKRWQEVGLGETGETYILGHDAYMRTISRPFVEDQQTYLNKLRKLNIDGDIIDKMRIYNTTILLQQNTSNAGKEVTEGITNTRTDRDYLRELCLSSYTPLTIQHVQWGIVAERDLNEAFAPIKALAWRIIFVTIIVLSIVIVAALFFIRMITKPLKDIIARITQPMISFKEKLPITTSDEISLIAQRYNELGDIISHTLYTAQTINNSLGHALQESMHHIQASTNLLNEKQSLTTEHMQLLIKHLATIMTLNQKSQDLEKQLHDTIKRIDV